MPGRVRRPRRGRASTVTRPGGGTEQRTYDKSGNLEAVTTPREHGTRPKNGPASTPPTRPSRSLTGGPAPLAGTSITATTRWGAGYDQQRGGQEKLSWFATVSEGKRDGAGLEYERNRYSVPRRGGLRRGIRSGLRAGSTPQVSVCLSSESSRLAARPALVPRY